jgi:hypothetical protein
MAVEAQMVRPLDPSPAVARYSKDVAYLKQHILCEQLFEHIRP